jgi:hypothetical protein
LHHGIADDSGSEEGDHASNQRIANIHFLVDLRVDVIKVGVKCEDREPVDKEHTEQSNNKELFCVIGYCLKDIFE